MFENQITYTIIMIFKDAAGSVRSIKVPNARPNVTGREVRQVMEQIVRDGVFLSRNGLPLVKLVRAVLVKVRWIFAAAKFTRGPVAVEEERGTSAPVESAGADVPTGCPTTSDMSCMLVPRPVGADGNNSRPPRLRVGGASSKVQTTGKSGVPTGCPTTVARLPRATVPSYGISDELFAKANAPCLRPVGADENNLLQSSNLLYFTPGCKDLRMWRNPGTQKDRGRMAAAA